MMKRPIPFLLFCLMILGIGSPMFGQGISYQAVARDASGVLIANQTVNVSFLIREGTDNGPVIYDESHSPTTNGFALFSVVIGEGNVTTGDFSTIDWAANDYFLEVEVNGASVGVTKFNAVPYSKVATDMSLDDLVDVDLAGAGVDQVLQFDGTSWVPATSAPSPWTASGSSVYYEGGSVGIGTSSPDRKLHVADMTGNSGDLMIQDNLPFLLLKSNSSSNSGILTQDNTGAQTSIWYYRPLAVPIIQIGHGSGAGSPNLVIDQNGNIGLNTTTPSTRLVISGTANTVESQLSLNNLQIGDMGSANLGLDGDLVPFGGSALAYDIGNNTSTEHWDDVVAADFITYSDLRVKENVEGLRVGLKEIMALRPVQYRYTRDFDVSEKLRFGLIAQEVEPILPNIVIQEDVDVNPETGAVERKPTELKTMTYMELVPVLIQAVQEQQAYIESLEARLEALESQANK